MFILLVHYGVNTPFYDQWETVPLLQNIDHHTLSFSDLWRQHNEHRVFFPTIALLASARITHWNTGVEVLISFLLAMITATLLFLLLRTQFKGWVAATAGSLFAAWFFSPIQWENWLWGWQVEWFMCITFVVLASFLLLKFVDTAGQRARRFLFAAALASAFIATFSLAGGIFAWLLGVAILVLRRQSRNSLILWSAAGVATTGLYYFHYTQTLSPSGPATTVLAHHPFLFIEFFIAFLGGPAGSLKNGLQTPDIIGTFLLISLAPLLYLTWQRRKNIRVYLPWLLLIVYGILCGLSTAFGRLGYSIGFALSSRYTAFSLLYVIGLTGLAFSLITTTPRLSQAYKKFCVTGVVLFSLPILISGYVVGIQGFKSHSSGMKAIKACTQAKNPSDDCLKLTYPSPSIVRPRLDYVKANHLAGY